MYIYIYIYKQSLCSGHYNPVWYTHLNTCFQFLNNITRTSTHFFTHTYFHICFQITKHMFLSIRTKHSPDLWSRLFGHQTVGMTVPTIGTAVSNNLTFNTRWSNDQTGNLAARFRRRTTKCFSEKCMTKILQLFRNEFTINGKYSTSFVTFYM